MRTTVATLILLVMVSCTTTPSFKYSNTEGVIQAVNSQSQPLAVLSWTAGLCLLAGVGLLVITSGKKGKWALIAGGGMILLNYAVAKYDAYLFYPLVGLTFLISAAYTYRIMKQILLEKGKQ